MKFKTIKEAAQEWVTEFNAIPQEVMNKLLKASNYCDCCEITPPAICNTVYVFDSGEYGEIIKTKENENGDILYVIEQYDKKQIELESDDFEIQRDEYFPMWGTMWAFADNCDDYWITEMGGLQIMADCGFRIYEQEDYGYVFGIDGCGYDFYEAHWIPLYKARGLQWHNTEEVTQ